MLGAGDVLLESDVVDGENERAGFGTGTEEDAADVVAVGAEIGKGNYDFRPVRARRKCLLRGHVAAGFGEEHYAVGAAVAVRPEMQGFFG